MMVEQSQIHQRVVQHCVISFPVGGPLKLLKPQDIKHVPHMCTTSIPIMPINLKNASKWQIYSSQSCHDPCDLLCWQLLSRLPLSCAKHHSVCGGLSSSQGAEVERQDIEPQWRIVPPEARCFIEARTQNAGLYGWSGTNHRKQHRPTQASTGKGLFVFKDMDVMIMAVNIIWWYMKNDILIYWYIYIYIKMKIILITK